MNYLLVNEDYNLEEKVEFESNKASEEALDYLGFRIEPKFSDCDDKVRQYFLIENETGNEIWNFFDYYHENACLTALTELGYTLYEDEKVLAFEL